jgi:hypothetical protein
MRKTLKAAIVALSLALAFPAAAQYTYAQPGQPAPQPIEVNHHVARVNLGVGFYNSGWYNCYYYYYGWYASCPSGSYTNFIPFLVGAQLDLNLGGMNNLSVGFTANMGTVSYEYYDVGNIYRSGSRQTTIWEPTLDYVAKFGPPTQDSVGRFRVGGALYFGPENQFGESSFGGGFRIGGGWSFFNTKRLGIGIDFVFEGGWIEGYWVGGLHLLASPEFHF